MKCPKCNTEMKALFTGFFCPNDCDKPEVLAKRAAERAEAIAKVEKAAAEVASGWVHPLTFWIPPAKPATPGVVNFATLKKSKGSGPPFEYKKISSTTTADSLDDMIERYWYAKYGK